MTDDSQTRINIEVTLIRHEMFVGSLKFVLERKREGYDKN